MSLLGWEDGEGQVLGLVVWHVSAGAGGLDVATHVGSEVCTLDTTGEG